MCNTGQASRIEAEDETGREGIVGSGKCTNTNGCS